MESFIEVRGPAIHRIFFNKNHPQYLQVCGVEMKILKKLGRIPDDLDARMNAFESDEEIYVTKGGLKYELDNYWLVGRLKMEPMYCRFLNVALIPFQSQLFLVGIQGIEPASHPFIHIPLAFYCMHEDDRILEELLMKVFSS
jgi:hypothetical protein